MLGLEMRELWRRFRRSVPGRRTVIERLEARRDRTTIVFASSRECAMAVRSCLRENHHRRCLHVALLMDGTGLSMELSILRRRYPWSLAHAVFGESHEKRWPDSVVGPYLQLDIAPTFLLGASRVVWFRSSEEPDVHEAGSGGWSCAVNTALARRLGLDTSCFDENGRPVPFSLSDPPSGPVSGDPGSGAVRELARWAAGRRAFTDRIRQEGIVLDPDWCEPALWSMGGGGIRAGWLDLSSPLIWRIHCLEVLLDSYHGELPPEEERAPFKAELFACASALRDELGCRVVVKEPNF